MTVKTAVLLRTLVIIEHRYVVPLSDFCTLLSVKVKLLYSCLSGRLSDTYGTPFTCQIGTSVVPLMKQENEAESPSLAVASFGPYVIAGTAPTVCPAW